MEITPDHSLSSSICYQSTQPCRSHSLSLTLPISQLTIWDKVFLIPLQSYFLFCRSSWEVFNRNFSSRPKLEWSIILSDRDLMGDSPPSLTLICTDSIQLLFHWSLLALSSLQLSEYSSSSERGKRREESWEYLDHSTHSLTSLSLPLSFPLIN